jgi:DNA (cytosine-5)-methyltransferase 1
MNNNRLGKVLVEENGYYHNDKPVICKGKKSKNKKPVVVELFCGCGGTSLGFEMAGYDVVLGLDIHSPSIETFKINHPHATTILGDIRTVESETIKKLIGNRAIDVLIGGVPCQGFSLNNKKRNSEDERNFLYKEFIRIAKDLKPKAIVIENVSGMKSTKNGEFVNSIESEMSEIGNYSVNSNLLNALDYGVPQKRQRLVFIAVNKNNPFLFDEIIKTHGLGRSKDYVTIKEAIGDLPNLNSGETGFEYKSEPFSDYQKLMRVTASERLLNHQAPNHPEDTIKKIADTSPGKPMYPKFKQRIRLAWDIQSPTQVSGGIRPQFQFGHPEDNRGLTIRERCRIQSFPDNFEVCGGIVQGRVQTGNAVPPLLAKAIAEALKSHLEDK